MVAAGTMSAAADGDPGASSLARLKTGNAQFVADPSAGLPTSASRRAALALGQSPFATVLSCADSRVPPEVIFRAGLGDLFVVRSMGHVADRAVLATVEYGVEQLHTPLIVVMGHESCGVVRAAIERPAGRRQPNLDFLLNAIQPAAVRTAKEPADVRLRAAILAHVEETINGLLDASSMLRERAETQQLTLVGAYYELATGRAHFSEPVRLIPRRAPAPAATKGAAPASVPRTAPVRNQSAPSSPAPGTPAAARTPAAQTPAPGKP